MPEFRYAPLTTVETVDAGSPVFQGTLMKYRSIGQGPHGPEVFLPGSFGNVEQAEILLNVQHDRSRPLARAPGTMQLVDTNSVLTLVAHPPDTTEVRDAKLMVQAKILTGLSIEFNATEHAHRKGVRVISRAELVGVGLVDTPAFPASTVEARRQQHEQRARLSLTISGLIPYETKLDCRCQSGVCDSVRLKRGSLNNATEPDREILLVAGDYGKALSSKQLGSLKVTEQANGLTVSSSLPDSQAARDLVAMAETVPLLIRPSFDQKASTFVEDGPTAIYSKMQLRAILIGASDMAQGWPPATLEEPPPEPRGLAAHQRRILRCL